MGLHLKVVRVKAKQAVVIASFQEPSFAVEDSQVVPSSFLEEVATSLAGLEVLASFVDLGIVTSSVDLEGAAA